LLIFVNRFVLDMQAIENASLGIDGGGAIPISAKGNLPRKGKQE